MVSALVYLGPVHHYLFWLMIEILEFITGEPWAGMM
jgi:hypothetical protein